MVDFEIADRIVNNLRTSHEQGRELRAKAMRMLAELPHFDWTGIYALEGETLVLDEYVGDETDHTRIPVGKGVCGTAVAENQNQVIGDVRNLSNYLACSLATRSEIVVLIRSESGDILGQIDVDGHNVGAFDSTDEHMLERIGAILGERWN